MRFTRALVVCLLASSPSLADQQPVLLGTGPLSGKGDPLFTAYTKLNANDADLYAQIASLQAQIASLQGISGRLAALNNGTIDGVAIGGTTPAAGSFTTLSVANGIAAAAYASTLSQAIDSLAGTARATIAVRGPTRWIGYTPTTSGCTFQFNGTDTVCAAASPGSGAVRYDASQGLTSGQQAQSRSNIAGAASGANGDITALSGLTTPLSLAQGGTGATAASAARTALSAAESGANNSITSLSGLTTALSIPQGGTGGSNAMAARVSLGSASSGANTDITSLSGLTTPLSTAQGGTGTTTGPAQPPLGQVRLVYSSATALLAKAYQGNLVTINGVAQTVPSAGVTCSSTGVAAGTLTYEYLWMNGATMACEVSTTGHATGSNGVEIKSGDATRTLVGMAYLPSAATFADNATQRLVASWFNRQGRALNSGTRAGYTTASTGTSGVELSTVQRVAFVAWADESVRVSSNAFSVNDASSSGNYLGMGVDGAVQGGFIYNSFQTAGYNTSQTVTLDTTVSEGYHYASPMAYVNAGNGTFNVQTIGAVRN